MGCVFFVRCRGRGAPRVAISCTNEDAVRHLMGGIRSLRMRSGCTPLSDYPSGVTDYLVRSAGSPWCASNTGPDNPVFLRRKDDDDEMSIVRSTWLPIRQTSSTRKH
ncbi:hypothetical protein Trydic_g9111 [Trypoxylus dichotomus]